MLHIWAIKRWLVFDVASTYFNNRILTIIFAYVFRIWSLVNAAINANQIHFSWIPTIRMVALIAFVWASPRLAPLPIGTAAR